MLTNGSKIMSISNIDHHTVSGKARVLYKSAKQWCEFRWGRKPNSRGVMRFFSHYMRRLSKMLSITFLLQKQEEREIGLNLSVPGFGLGNIMMLVQDRGTQLSRRQRLVK